MAKTIAKKLFDSVFVDMPRDIFGINTPESLESLLLTLWNKENQSELRILVTGKTGQGKSTLINGILGCEVAKEGAQATRCTTEVEVHSKVIKNISIKVFDSPGLQDGTSNNEAYIEKMRNMCQELSLIVYCTKMTNTRLTDDDKNAMRVLTEAFGEGFWNYTVFVLTFANREEVSRRDDRDDSESDTEDALDGEWTEVEKKRFRGRLKIWKEGLQSFLISEVGVNPNIATKIPVVPTGDYKKTKRCLQPLRLPDRDNWFNSFWEACCLRVKNTHLFLKINSDRMVAANKADDKANNGDLEQEKQGDFSHQGDAQGESQCDQEQREKEKGEVLKGQGIKVEAQAVRENDTKPNFIRAALKYDDDDDADIPIPQEEDNSDTDEDCEKHEDSTIEVDQIPSLDVPEKTDHNIPELKIVSAEDKTEEKKKTQEKEKTEKPEKLEKAEKLQGAQSFNDIRNMFLQMEKKEATSQAPITCTRRATNPLFMRKSNSAQDFPTTTSKDVQNLGIPARSSSRHSLQLKSSKQGPPISPKPKRENKTLKLPEHTNDVSISPGLGTAKSESDLSLIQGRDQNKSPSSTIQSIEAGTSFKSSTSSLHSELSPTKSTKYLFDQGIEINEDFVKEVTAETFRKKFGDKVADRCKVIINSMKKPVDWFLKILSN